MKPHVFKGNILAGGLLFLRALGFALVASALAGCASVEIGSAFDLQPFETGVQRGVTTRAQVQAWLGAPASRGVAVDSSGQRFEEWIYYHGEGQLPRLTGVKLKILQIRFDADGIVRAYNWSGSP
jgi:outer membrane protein assembly factor BamE (lipoprotein component of BamABCDE complex)